MWLTPGSVEVQARGKSTVEISHGTLMLLGGKEGQTDIGAGFLATSGAGAVTVLDGRKDAPGLSVVDRETNTTKRWPE